MAKQFYSAGHEMYLLGRNLGGLKRLRTSIGDMEYRVSIYKCDISVHNQIHNSIREILRKADSIDIMINCSGILGEQAEIHASDITIWQKVLAVNLTGVYFAMRVVLPHMVKQRRGIVINLSSNRAKYYRERSGAYSVSKFGVEALTNIADLECQGYGVRCFAINPGRVATKMRRQVAPDEDQRTISTPEEIALFCLKVCNPAIYVKLPCSIDYDTWKDKMNSFS